MHGKMEYDTIEGRKQAWHGLAIVREDLAIENCHLNNYDVERAPVYMLDAQGQPIALAGQTVLRCTDNGHVIGTSSKESYGVITNKRFLEMVQAATDGLGLTLVSVGTVHNRGRKFMSFASKDLPAIITGGREFTHYLSFMDSWDRTMLATIVDCETCVVCNNTVEIARQAAGAQRAKHTKSVETKFESIADAIGAAQQARELFHSALTSFHAIACDKDTATAFFAGFIGTGEALSTRAENNVSSLVALYNGGAGNRGETWLDVFQAGTDAFTHEFAKSDDAWSQFESSEFGNGRAEKQRLFQVIQDETQRQATIQLGNALIAGRAKKQAEVVAA